MSARIFLRAELFYCAVNELFSAALVIEGIYEQNKSGITQDKGYPFYCPFISSCMLICIERRRLLV